MLTCSRLCRSRSQSPLHRRHPQRHLRLPLPQLLWPYSRRRHRRRQHKAIIISIISHITISNRSITRPLIPTRRPRPPVRHRRSQVQCSTITVLTRRAVIISNSRRATLLPALMASERSSTASNGDDYARRRAARKRASDAAIAHVT